MSHDRKDTDNPNKPSTSNAVDRASSVTPLNDDRHLDPATISESVRQKQGHEHAKPGNPQAGPGPVKAQPNQVRDRDQRDVEPTPKKIEDEIQNSPREKAKEESKNESSHKAARQVAQKTRIVP